MPQTCRFNFLIRACVQRGELRRARKLFDGMPHRNTFSANMMIMGYIQSGDLATATNLFDGMDDRNAVSWTMLIGGYAQNNRFREAFGLFVEMCRHGVEPDYVTFSTLLSGFTEFDSVNEVTQVHAYVVKLGHNSAMVVSNSLLDSYCKTRSLGLACQLFEHMPMKDSVTYNALMAGYSKEGLNHEALNLFFRMQDLEFKPTEFTFATVLCCGIQLDDIEFGQQVHSLLLKTNFVWNVFVANALLDFYSKHDRVAEAQKLFNEMPELDGISYNVLITCYVWNGRFKESIELFRELHLTRFNRRQFPYATLLSMAANALNLEMGRQIHSQAIVTAAISDNMIGNSLVDMYAKCDRFGEANRIFANLALQSSVPWTALISGNVQKGHPEEGIKLFIEMQRAEKTADAATYASILKACANLASQALGKQLHSHIIRSGCLSNVFSGSALLDMYAKCGSIENALQMFQEMPVRNSVSWNALISAYAQNGDGENTLRSFEQMVHSGLKPNAVSFLSVLCACSHCGLVEEGLQYFNSMTQIYEVTPKREHYTSMVDMLCRSGRFEEAVKMMAQMPFEPDEIMWSSVLNSCRIHKNQELAKKAADQLFSMKELRDAAPYVSMANIYAEIGEWENVGKVKTAMRSRGIRKVPAYSWVEIKHKTHVFSANNKSHPQMKEITRKLDDLEKQMEKEGYKPDLSCALHNEDNELKAESLKYHSERIAIAYALISTSEGSPIVVMKNIRACTNCHAAIKAISKIVGREITALADILPKETLLWKLKLLRSASAYANSRLHAVKAQALILSSEKDELLPSKEEGERLRKLLANSELCKFADSGYFLFLEGNIDLVTVIKGTSFYCCVKKHDYVSDYIPPTPTEFKEVLNSYRLLNTLTSPVMLSTLEDGTIVKVLAGLPSEGPVIYVGRNDAGLLPDLASFDSLRVMGAVPVAATNLFKLLSSKSLILLYPGGMREALHRKVNSNM
ncbi:hypothetical protein AHAS_Ahas16G0233800 [Arachis hypogaea]